MEIPGQLSAEIDTDATYGWSRREADIAVRDVRPVVGGSRQFKRRRLRSRSLLLEPRFAQALRHPRKVWIELTHQFDRKLRVHAARLGQGDFRLCQLPLQSIGDSQLYVGWKNTITSVNRLVRFLDRRIEMSEAEFSQ